MTIPEYICRQFKDDATNLASYYATNFINNQVAEGFDVYQVSNIVAGTYVWWLITMVRYNETTL